MELFATKNEYLIVSDDFALHCCRKTGKLTPKTSSILCELNDPQCIGVVYGVLGRLSLNSNKENYILLVKQCKNIGAHPLNQKFVYKIQQVVALPLSTNDNGSISGSDFNITFDVCKKHSGGINSEIKKRTNIELNFLQKQQKKVLKATSDSLKFVSDQVVSRPEKQDASSKKGFGVKILDEILKLFNENCSFYFSDADLTNCLQRHVDGATYDERFFWNRTMLSDLLNYSDGEGAVKKLANFWIKPIIQGFIEMSTSEIDLSTSIDDIDRPGSLLQYDLTLISRRSVRRAGTRYIKRGVDDAGDCANFVETEQILSVCGHSLSFVQIRASIPLYWSQSGYKYKPAPRIDRSKNENVVAFRRHFENLHSTYGDLIAVSLIDQTGKEKVLSDAFVEYFLDFDADYITHVAFDFHEYCRGLKFENVSILVDALADSIFAMKFCWVDKRREFICRQTSTFRVNCVDCLDRTNVVQSELAKAVLEIQLRKLGLLFPEQLLEKKCQASFQSMWANNGDVVSLQYTGTAALKGDFTRTGQRNFAGIMRDGYNSANRYYLCHMKDARRQAAIDVLLGRNVSTTDIESDLRRSVENETQFDENSWLKEKDENLRLLVLDCEKLVLPHDAVLLASWALIDADVVTGDENEDDMDRVVMLTRDAYYVADYVEELDKFVDFQRVNLKNIDSIEVGPMTVSTLFGVARSKSVCVRVNYTMIEEGYFNRDRIERGYFHVWRAGGTRLFNNLAIAIKSKEDADEYMHAIAEQFNVAIQVAGLTVPVKILSKLERKKSKMPPHKVIDRKNFGFISNLLSPLTGVKPVGGIIKSGNKSFQRNTDDVKSPSVVENLEKITPTIVKTFVDDESESKIKRSDTIHGDDCGVLFSSVGVDITDEEGSKDSNSIKRRFSDASAVGAATKLTGDVIQSSSPSIELVPHLIVNDNQKPLQHGVSDSEICIEISPPIGDSASNLLAVDPASMKTSHSESSLKKYETSKVEKSSSSVMLEKLVDGRTFFQNVGQRFHDGAQKTLLAVGAKKPAAGHHNVNNWRQYEEKIKSSRTKFILL